MNTTTQKSAPFVEAYYGKKTHLVAWCPCMFVTQKFISSPSSPLGKRIVMTLNEDESPVCYYNGNGCLHRGSQYNLNDTWNFCSMGHMEDYIHHNL